VHWLWSDAKNRLNKQKHGLRFKTARLVFDDPLAPSRVDAHPDGDRWQTVGTVHLFVVHTWPEPETETDYETGRIVSARKATSHERKAYEEGAF
jgi:uncharacterized DUF497 family protein